MLEDDYFNLAVIAKDLPTARQIAMLTIQDSLKVATTNGYQIGKLVDIIRVKRPIINRIYDQGIGILSFATEGLEVETYV